MFLIKLKKYMYALKIFIIISSINFLSSCEDLFLRFKYHTVECQKNSLNLKKISIKKESIGSYADVQFGDFYNKIEITTNNNEVIVLKNKDLDIEIEIYKEKQKVEVRLKNNIKILNCKMTTFKM